LHPELAPEECYEDVYSCLRLGDYALWENYPPLTTHTLRTVRNYCIYTKCWNCRGGGHTSRNRLYQLLHNCKYTNQCYGSGSWPFWPNPYLSLKK
jgi:hypothetical protein